MCARAWRGAITLYCVIKNNPSLRVKSRKMGAIGNETRFYGSTQVADTNGCPLVKQPAKSRCWKNNTIFRLYFYIVVLCVKFLILNIVDSVRDGQYE